MKLSEYLEAEQLSAAKFGEKIGAGRSAVTRWLKGERLPRGKQIRLIVEATGGKVTADDLMGTTPRAAA